MEERAGYRAVVTTGIYCRAGCPARPNERNVRGYAVAAEAEAAGFRPCHRCRPYRSSEPARWMDAPEVVCRAVQLIAGGALDRGTEADVARQVGISARHLRRLFGAHVGATPDQLARSRRAHFARRLLDDTDLGVTDVAFAAGFGSARQMNRVMLEVFRASPSELRARRRLTDRLVADGGLELRLPFRPPLDLESTLSFLAPRCVPGIEAVDGDTYRRTIEVDGHAGVVEVLPAGPEIPELLVRFHLPTWEGLLHLTHRARRMFDLDSDPVAAAAHLGADPVLAPLVRERPGRRLPGAWDPFEAGVRALLGQQVTVGGATTLTARLVARFGRPVGGLGRLGLSHVFPAPEALATADIAAVGVPAARAAAVSAFAAAYAAGDLPLDAGLSLDDVIGSLTAVRGIGPWTANYVALRLGERDAFPAGDLALRRVYAVASGTDAVTTATLDAAAEAWRPWRAYAAVHLWGAYAGSRRAGVCS